MIADAVGLAQERNRALGIVGTAAVPVLEGWILALLGESGTESLKKVTAQRRLLEKGIDEKNTQAMVEVASSADIGAIPKDARSLRSWLAKAAVVLPAASSGSGS